MSVSLLQRFQGGLLGSTLFLAEQGTAAFLDWIALLESLKLEEDCWLEYNPSLLTSLHPLSWPDILRWLLSSLLYHDYPEAMPALRSLDPLTQRAWQNWRKTLALILRGQELPRQAPGPLLLPWLDPPLTPVILAQGQAKNHLPFSNPTGNGSPLVHLAASEAWLTAVLAACYYWADTPSQVALSAHRVQQQGSVLTSILTGALSGAYNGLATVLAWSSSSAVSSSQCLQLYQLGTDLYRRWSGSLCCDAGLAPGLVITGPLVMQARPSLKLLSQTQYWVNPS